MGARKHILILSALVAVVLIPSVLSASDGERVHFFQDITVGPDEQVGDVVCIGCSIHIAGTSGDTVAILGSIEVDGTVRGDVVAVGGGIRLNEDANVGGDTVALGRGISRHPNTIVKGEVVSQSGPLLFAGIVIIPLLPIIVIVLLVVWLLRRDRPPVPPVAAYRR